MTVTRLSTAAISRSSGNVPSIDPSASSTISKASPLASITDLSRAYKSVTFSCSLWSGTTIEYLSTVSFIIRQRAVGFVVTSVRREVGWIRARTPSFEKKGLARRWHHHGNQKRPDSAFLLCGPFPIGGG